MHVSVRSVDIYFIGVFLLKHKKKNFYIFCLNVTLFNTQTFLKTFFYKILLNPFVR